jgi:hypothetical protein
MVYMIYKPVVWNDQHLPVHKHLVPLASAVPDRSLRITYPPISAVSGRMPFVLGKTLIIFTVHYRIFALRQRYPAERIPVPQAPITQQHAYTQPVNKLRDKNPYPDFFHYHGRFRTKRACQSQRSGAN